MRIQTRGNTNVVWLSSETGVIDGTMTLSVTPLEKILQAVNEKYGTSFESWSQLPTAYEVGDTVPNWNAYEKIVLAITNVKLHMSDETTLLAIGNVVGKQFSIIGNANGGFYRVWPSGEVEGVGNDARSYAEIICKPKLIAAGYDILSTKIEVKSYEVGENIEDWQSYIEV